MRSIDNVVLRTKEIASRVAACLELCNWHWAQKDGRPARVPSVEEVQHLIDEKLRGLVRGEYHGSASGGIFVGWSDATTREIEITFGPTLCHFVDAADIGIDWDVEVAPCTDAANEANLARSRARCLSALLRGEILSAHQRDILDALRKELDDDA